VFLFCFAGAFGGRDTDDDFGTASHPPQDFRDWPILPIKVQPTYKLLGYAPQKPVPVPSHLPLEKNRTLRVGGEDEYETRSLAR
jgi:hypothetical protein